MKNLKKRSAAWPSKKQWLRIFTVLARKEKIFLFICLGLFLSSALFLSINFYIKNTEIRPAMGSKYTEGVVGSPRFINPIYAQGNDVDRDLVEIIFSGLMKYDPNGKIVPDLTKEIEIKEDGTIYEVYLKEDVFWHDGKPLTADDVIFTIKTIQNPDYKSPLRGNYLGVEVEKINEYGVYFKLKKTYNGFLERLTFKIMPSHIWQDISPQNFLLTNYNLKPVGSGPYRFKEIKQDATGSISSLTLVKTDGSYLSKITFKFFETEKELLEAVEKGDVDGLAIKSGNTSAVEKNKFREYSFSSPRYFTVFFNPDKSMFLADKKIREALNHAINKAEIVEKLLSGRGKIVDSPILPEIYGYQSPAKIYEFSPEKAEELLANAGLEKQEGKWMKITKEKIVEFKTELKLESRGTEVTALQTCLSQDPKVYPEGKITGYFSSQTKEAVIKFQEKYFKDILEPWGFKKGTGIVGKATRVKLNEVCSKPGEETQVKFTLITVEDPILEKVATYLKDQWEKIGIGIEVQILPISKLEKEVIKPRNYQMLLFGEVLEATADPFPFWHSSQIKDPGLNLARYENKTVDKLLETARTALISETHIENLQKFQNVLIEDAPSVFLYSPDYTYFVSKKIKGLEMNFITDFSKRFSNIENWYIRTQRLWR